MKYARLGSVSEGTLKSEKLIEAIAHCLEDCILLNGDRLSKPENLELRNRLNAAKDTAFEKILDKDEVENMSGDEAVRYYNSLADELDKITEAMIEFTPPYSYFGAHNTDAASFGFWIDSKEIKDAIDAGDMLAVQSLEELQLLPKNNRYDTDFDHGDYAVIVDNFKVKSLYAFDPAAGWVEVWSV